MPIQSQKTESMVEAHYDLKPCTVYTALDNMSINLTFCTFDTVYTVYDASLISREVVDSEQQEMEKTKQKYHKSYSDWQEAIQVGDQ